MRTFLSALLVLVAVVAGVIALPSMWATQKVIDRDGFRTMSVDAAHDKDLQSAVSEEIVRQVDDLMGAATPTSLVRSAADRYVSSSMFPDDFGDAVAQQHDYLFDEPTTTAEREGVLQLDLTSMVRRALDTANLSGISLPGKITVPLDEGKRSGLRAGRYHEVSGQIRTWAYVSLAAFVIAALGALLVARRRGFTLSVLGLGVVVAAAVSFVGSVVVDSRAKDEVSDAESSARTVADILIDHAAADLRTIALYVGIGGVVAFVLGIIGSLIGRR